MPYSAVVLAIGCGFGWFSRWAVAEGRNPLPANMLAHVRADTADARIEYVCADLGVEAPDRPGGRRSTHPEPQFDWVHN